MNPWNLEHNNQFIMDSSLIEIESILIKLL